MDDDETLREKVVDELKCSMLLDACNIDISVQDGIVTIVGKVEDLSKKQQAEDTVTKVDGVKCVVNRIDVSFNTWDQNRDSEITDEILNAFKWNWNTSKNTINVNVVNGWVTLSGELDWNYQREAAKTAIAHLIGVKGITNDISIRSISDIVVNKDTVEHALKSHVEIATANINAIVFGHEITLAGNVETWYQKELAGRVAWKAPGVTNVINQLVVDDE